MVLLFAGFMYAQQQTQTTTTTTTTNFNGTLVDWGCQSTHTETKESSTSRPDESTTRTETKKTTTEHVDCPVTTTTTTFGLLTPEGQVVRFDEPSNTKIVEVVKSNKKWNEYITRHDPVKVRVVGTRRGDVVVMESIR